MPDLTNLLPFHSGKVENFYLLVLGQVKIYKVNIILYFIFLLIIRSSLETLWILISWLRHRLSESTRFTRMLISGGVLFILFSKEQII